MVGTVSRVFCLAEAKTFVPILECWLRVNSQNLRMLWKVETHLEKSYHKIAVAKMDEFVKVMTGQQQSVLNMA